MSYEQTYFGDGSAAGSGNVVSTVHHQYGAFQAGKTVGVTERDGFENELSLDIDAAMVTATAFPLIAPKLPKGALIHEVYAYVSEAFVLGGTAPTILVGTETSEATNHVVLSQAQAQAVGMYDLTATRAGTWAAGLAADTIVGIALGGTTPTNGTTGKVRIVIRYAEIKD